ERGETIGLLDDDTRVRFELRVRQLALEQLSGTAQTAERILHLVRELADDAPRQALLREQRSLAPHLAVAVCVDELEQQHALVLERARAAIEDELAARHARAELAQAEGQARRQRTPAERDELRRRMHEIADRVTRDAARADAEQRLGREVQVRDHQVLVEDDERGREALQDAAGVDALAAAAVRS